MHDGVKDGFGQVPLEGHALDEAAAVPDEQETQLALVGAVVDPTLYDDLLPDVLGDGFQCE